MAHLGTARAGMATGLLASEIESERLTLEQAIGILRCTLTFELDADEKDYVEMRLRDEYGA